MTGGLLTDAVDELYSSDPAGFTQRRDELAARARPDGQAQAARQIARLRKPTRPVSARPAVRPQHRRAYSAVE